MRLIGTLEDERQAVAFSRFLTQKGITHQIEILTNRDWGSPNYGTSQCRVWIYDEDQMEEALKWFQAFVENPNDSVFQPFKIAAHPALIDTTSPLAIPPLPPSDSESEEASRQTSQRFAKQPMGPITRLLLLICCGLFFLNEFLTPSPEVPANVPLMTPFTSKIDQQLSYDYPYKYQLINKFLQTYGYEGTQNIQELPNEGKFLLKKIKDTPSWPGFYSIVHQKGVKAIPNAMESIPMFEKIRQGEIWRLFTPALLHADIFHLFFNMLWLIVLGKQIEQRLKIGCYLLFILLTGIFSNTSQYLMGGPNFIGFSGILCAMLAFIWIRQRKAPWEGYLLDRMTMIFIMLFIASMALLQLFFFFVEVATDETISSGIANTAHLSGALIGYLLGRFNFFSWRHA